MAKTKAILAAALIVSVSHASASTWYVDRTVGTSGDGTSWETAFKMIQEGINAASDGDAVIVAEGTYFENVHFGGKNIVLRSRDPLDPGVVERTAIEPSKAGGSVVTFAGTETGVCVLSGFTIRKGEARDGGGICGGTSSERTNATIANNVIISNTANLGGGSPTATVKYGTTRSPQTRVTMAAGFTFAGAGSRTTRSPETSRPIPGEGCASVGSGSRITSSSATTGTVEVGWRTAPVRS